MNSIKIRKLFNFRTQRKFGTDVCNDGWILDILKSSNNTECYITSNTLDNKITINDINDILKKGFFISAVFYCGNIFTTREEEVCLFVFDKNKPEKIKLGFKELKSFDKNNKSKYIEINKDLPKDYSQYIFEIEQWINNDIKPEFFTQNNFFGEIEYNKYNPEENLNPLYYLNVINNEKNIEKKAKLSDYAEIIKPKNLKKYTLEYLKTKIITAEIYDNKFDFCDIEIGAATDTELIKNDLLINTKNKIYIHQKDFKTRVYVSANNQILLRAKKDINIRALYCVLKSDENLSYKNISPDMPVIKIDQDTNYDEFFNLLIGKKHEYSGQAIKDNNLIEAINNLVQKKFQTIISNDLKEIDCCYKNNAYKAAVILCGSVLEAFLYDWLQEKNIQIEKEWNLQNYINQIKDLYEPEWLDAAEKAHEIRKKRNYIHPKKYIDKGTLIDKKLCDDMKNYLKYVIKTRIKMNINHN